MYDLYVRICLQISMNAILLTRVRTELRVRMKLAVTAVRAWKGTPDTTARMVCLNIT